MKVVPLVRIQHSPHNIFGNVKLFSYLCMILKCMIEEIKQKLKQHHQLYRFPVKAELWEDIYDQVINSGSLGWNMGGHDVGTDVVSKDGGIRYQNKAGKIDLKNGTITWSGHRTTKHKTINEKVNFISEKHCDKYVMLARNKDDWDSGIKKYYLLIFDSHLIDYSKLNWTEYTTKDTDNVAGWKGDSNEIPVSAKIIKTMSDQLWTEAKLDYLGEPIEIVINNDTNFFEYKE